MRHLADGALLDRDLVAVGAAEIDRGKRRGDVERDRVPVRQHGERIGADLVGDVAVRRRPIGADDHAAHPLALHQMTRHVVGDERHGDAVLLQLPRGEPRALEEGSRLAGDDLDTLAGVDRRPHDGQRRPEARGRQRPGVAVGEDGGAVLEQRGAMHAERTVRRHVLVVDRERLALEQRPDRVRGAVAVAREDAAHALDGPEEIHGRRARRGEGAAEALEVAGGVGGAQRARAERDTHGRRDADRRRAADDHVLDGARDLAVVAIDAVDLARRQHALVEHDHAAASPLDGSDWHGVRRPPRGAYPNRLPRNSATTKRAAVLDVATARSISSVHHA